MSRIGAKPIPIPKSVQIDVRENEVSVKGPKGTLTKRFHPDMTITLEDSVLKVARPSDERLHRSLHGLTRSLLANMVTGVNEGFQKTLDLVGVGYRVQQAGEKIVLELGFTHTVEVTPLPGTKLVAEGNNRIHVQGPDKEMVGEVAARIRAIRRPNAYTGKGVRYVGEAVRLKPGKSTKKA